MPSLGSRFKRANHPLSLACEGNFSLSRKHIIESMMAHSYPVGRGCRADQSLTFVTMLCKPSFTSGMGWGRGTNVGGPVHDEDKLVVQRLLGLGEGVAGNEAFQGMFEEISKKPEADGSFNSDKWTWQKGSLSCKSNMHGINMTVLDWPAAPWLSKVTKLDLSHNSLTTLPEALFSSLPNLEHLNLNQNCLWELSPSVGLLKSLKVLSLKANCLESLPSDVATLPRMESIDCGGNPMIEPPKAVCRGGWAAVKSCKVAHLALPLHPRSPCWSRWPSPRPNQLPHLLSHSHQ